MGLIRIDRDQETNARQLSWDVDRSDGETPSTIPNPAK
jgi:hypothetical protein